MPSRRSNNGTFRPRGYRVPGNELDMTVVDQALRVGSPVSVDSEPDIPEVHTDHTRRIIREVEVPYERKVRVPVRTKKIVQDVQRVKVPVQKLKEVPVTRTVKEKYTDYVEQEAVRDKEVWVKKIVQEKYMKRVPVVRTRNKQIQEVELRPYTDTMEVEVPIDRETEEVGFRVDTVKDTKLVEVEEVEHYKLVPEKTNQREVVRTHELGAVRRRDGGAGHIERRVGESVYDPDDVASISTDSDPDDDYQPPRINTRSLGAPAPRTRSINTRSINNTSSYRETSRRLTSRSGTSMRPVSRGGDPFASTASRPTTANVGGILGVVLKNAERGGCRVVRVLDRSPAFQAGVKVNDIIVEVDSRQTNDLSQFRNAVGRSGGLIHLSIKRSGTIVTLRCTRK